MYRLQGFGMLEVNQCLSHKSAPGVLGAAGRKAGRGTDFQPNPVCSVACNTGRKHPHLGWSWLGIQVLGSGVWQ